MPGSTQAQRWEGVHGEDIRIVLTGEDNTDPTTFAMSFTIARHPGMSAVLTISTPTITVAGSGPYTITIPITRAQSGTTLSAADEWAADLWRTDSGSNRRMANGILILSPPVKSAS